ncbi:aminomethyl-transferring glycine dehydrogenase subunit GcvPA, partial [bacterium]|nr:aminomethyl-transferring glycine dehydrogenase subunit GcvPA [bacterium]
MTMSPFVSRHIGPNNTEIQSMLQTVGVSTLEQLMQKTVPANIYHSSGLDLPQGLTETQVLEKARSLALKNKNFKNFIGLGYYGTYTPTVILRNILENPGWYTAYTPYQPEISQGRLEALINFQTMVSDLTGMELSNASLLDEGTAAAEAMAMAHSLNRQNKNVFFIDKNIFPQTLEVIQTRALPLGIELIIGDFKNCPWEKVFAIFTQYPGANGQLEDFQKYSELAKAQKALTIVSTDLLALTLYKAPGEMGADIVVGSSQRFGVPMGFGGPHAAFLATKESFARSIPGRIVGVSKDSRGKACYRLTLQTREQHIRREKATSNICTAQVLLAVMAGMYGVYHGPAGLKKIAQKIKSQTLALKEALQKIGLTSSTTAVFDTLSFTLAQEKISQIKKMAQDKGVNFFYPSSTTVQFSIDETTTQSDLELVAEIFAGGLKTKVDVKEAAEGSSLQRTSPYMTHPVFNRYHSETEMLRYIFKLQKK